MEQTNSLPNPSVPSQMSTNPSVSPPSSKKPVLIILLVVSLVILSSLITYLFTKSRVPTPVSHPVPITQASPTPLDETANWKTFTDNKNEWQIKYPETYFKYKGDPSLDFFIATSAPVGGSSTKFQGPEDVWLSVNSFQSKYSSLDEYLESSSIYKNPQKSSVKIGGISAYKVDYTVMVGPAEPFTPQYVSEGLILKNGKIYSIGMASWSKNALEKNKVLFDQILSTFKFQDSENESIGIQTTICCSCPTKISPSLVGKDGWVLYEKGKDYSLDLPKNCTDVHCKPCPTMIE